LGSVDKLTGFGNIIYTDEGAQYSQRYEHLPAKNNVGIRKVPAARPEL
jgi:hypothetical protein